MVSPTAGPSPSPRSNLRSPRSGPSRVRPAAVPRLAGVALSVLWYKSVNAESTPTRPKPSTSPRQCWRSLPSESCPARPRTWPPRYPATSARLWPSATSRRWSPSRRGVSQPHRRTHRRPAPHSRVGCQRGTVHPFGRCLRRRGQPDPRPTACRLRRAVRQTGTEPLNILGRPHGARRPIAPRPLRDHRRDRSATALPTPRSSYTEDAGRGIEAVWALWQP